MSNFFITPTAEEQKRILKFTQQNIDLFTQQSKLYREQMLEVYEAISTFELPDTGDNLTRFKINKAHEIVRKVVPRIVGRSPKFLVSPRTDIFNPGDEKKAGKDREKMLKDHQLWADAANNYLNILFKDKTLRKKLKLWVIAQLTYGDGHIQIVPKFKIQRSKTPEKKVTEKVVGVTPTIDNISWTEMYYDPRYQVFEDMPGLLRVRRRMRLQDVLFTDGMIHKKEAKELAGTKFIDIDSYTQSILAVTGISEIQLKQGIDANNLTTQVYEGLFSLTGEAKDEKLYKLTTINAAIVIGVEEITEISFLNIKGHEDPEISYAVGLVAPILGLQSEINFQKNAQATAMSKSLNRSYYWAPESGVDPSNLISDRAGNIIVCTNGVDNAKRHLEEQADRQLPNQYFSNINDYNRDIQTMTHTTDVTSPGGAQALTNTATGARLSFFESNSVIAEIRKNFEDGVAQLGVKFLDFAANNIDKDITIKDPDTKEFMKINIEAIRNAVERYDITIIPNSSSFDDLENRRADAIAKKNIGIEAINAGADVDVNKLFKDVYSTFEGTDVDELIKTPEETLDLQGLLGGGAPEGGPEGQIKGGGKVEPKKKLTPAEETDQIATGNLKVT